jgi:uncharacterized cupin superfamily protein
VPDWFVVNVADATALSHERAGKRVMFDNLDEPFPEIGINIRVLQPGQPNAKYHSESVQEDFLVLSGECLVIVDDEERQLRAWDFVHCPAGTPHVFVGAGEGPCAILMVGARHPAATVHYPVSDAAARFGASVAKATADEDEAYAEWDGGESIKPTKLDWPPST